MRGDPGWKSDAAVEAAAFAHAPLRDFLDHEFPAIGMWVRRGIWRSGFFVKPRMQRALRKVARLSAIEPAPPSQQLEPSSLTNEIKALGVELGISALGVADYDPKYRFKDFAEMEPGNERVIVCILEENYPAQQTAPSVRHDRASLSTYVELMKREVKIAECLNGYGYRAFIHDVDGQAVVIPYAVAAGLGQLGLNGQLLTPFAGSRFRIMLISTNAPLIVDKPRDYGIPAICDRCRACVRRCPANALTAKRDYYRGVYKAKLNTARCLPVLASNQDCDICTTVCPVQRYGLGPIYEEFEKTGKILGRLTDDLEGYEFGGRHYGPGEKPKLSREFFQVPVLRVIPPRVPDSHKPWGHSAKVPTARDRSADS